MKTTNRTIAILIAASTFFATCQKEKPTDPAVTGDSYSSLADFYSQNGVPMQVFSVNATTGGSFTTPKGTQVTIPANCFMDQQGNPVTGTVNIEFKDLYDKSDMLLSQMPTMMKNGAPLKSGGEFFIRVKSGTKALLLNGSNPVTVKQPLNGWAADPGMLAFSLSPADTLGWKMDSSNVQLDSGSVNYIFDMYNFQTPADSGSWSNSDNSYYFSSYTQTQLTLHAANNPTGHAPEVFLLFTGINSMVHVYFGSGSDFPYQFAPLGLQCTMVAVAVGTNKKVYSSFVPITITANQTVNFSLTETSTAAFKTELKKYNH